MLGIFLSYLVFFSSAFAFARSETGLKNLYPIGWAVLQDFYGNHMPSNIDVKFKNFPDGNSKFNCSTNTIFINSKIKDQKMIESLTVHEGSHIALCKVTSQFNIDPKSRFWDEGLATIVQVRSMNKETTYRKRSHKLARIQYELNNLEFFNMENWDSYSREANGKINSYGYGVGSSFNYFLIGTYGEPQFKVFLQDLGKTKDFAKSLQNIFKLNESQTHKKWVEYLQRIHD